MSSHPYKLDNLTYQDGLKNKVDLITNGYYIFTDFSCEGNFGSRAGSDRTKCSKFRNEFHTENAKHK